MILYLILLLLTILLIVYYKVNTLKNIKSVISVKQFLITEIITIPIFMILYLLNENTIKGFVHLLIIAFISGIFTSIVLDKIVTCHYLDKLQIKILLYIILFLSIILFTISFYKINSYKNGSL